MDDIKLISYELAKIMKQKAVLDDREKSLRAELLERMKANKRTTASNDFLSIKVVPASQRVRVDSHKLQSQFPDVYEECCKTSTVGSYVQCSLKRGALNV